MKPIGRNDKCPCGSGKKYKQCCMPEDESRKAILGEAATALRKAFALQQGGQRVEAEALCRQVLQRVPNHSEALYLLGVMAFQAGEHEVAAEFISRSSAADPSNPVYYNYLGNICNKLGNLDQAITRYQKALSLKPDDAVVRYNLANTLVDQGRLDEAAADFKKALLLTTAPSEAQLRAAIYYQLGYVYHEMGHDVDAINSYQEAILLRQDFLEAYNCLGNILLEKGRIEEAIANYRKAITIKPDDAAVCANMGNAYFSLGRVEEAVEYYQQAFVHAPYDASPYNNYLMVIQYSPKYKEQEILAAHRAFAEKFEAPLRRYWPLHENTQDPERRLRVGFVSGDFRTHPVAFFTEALLAHLSSDSLEIVLYHNHKVTDEVTLRLKSFGYLWRSLVDVTDEQAAQLVQDDNIDILIDLSGHTNGNRLLLFARKPAPVQVAWLGYFDTTGLQAMDYILGDPYMLPPGEADHYVETPWQLPETYLCFTPPHFNVEVEALPALSNGFITFGSFNTLTKLNDEVVALWSRVLHAVPESRLFLKTQQFNDPVALQNTVRRFSLHGIDAGRLILEGSSSHVEHFSAYNRMDVALDPFPFPGGTTSVNALWMGVPVLHLQGHRFISHAGESILNNVGLPEWIAADADDYVRLAQELTGNLSRLSALRVGLRNQLLASPLCDAPRFAQNFETALRGMWRNWCSKTETKEK